MARDERKKLIKIIILSFILLISYLLKTSFAHQPNLNNTLIDKRNELRPKLFISNMIPFIENRGQINEDFIYYTWASGAKVHISKNGEIFYTFKTKDKKVATIKEFIFKPKKISVMPQKISMTKINYFKTNDQNKWKINIPTYERLSLREIYKEIDLELKIDGKNLEKIFYINPGANIEDITMVIEGAKSININSEGTLVIQTEYGDFLFSRPIAYQYCNGKRIDVDVSYVIKNDKIRNQNSSMAYGFQAGGYDKTKTLIIDPILASTYLGGSGDDFGIEIALDNLGNIVVGGVTDSYDFPGAPESSINNDDRDIFVTKINPAGDTIIFTTIIGGSDDEMYSTDPMELYRFGMALDKNGDIYLTANTKSYDFPTTLGAYDTTFNGGNTDVFVTKLSSTGDNLIYSTYLGGSGDEFGGGIAVDIEGNAYVTGKTKSNNFPTTLNAYEKNYKGGGDIFVTKINSSGSNLIYSTFLGGSSWDEATDIAIDSQGNAYILGGGDSKDYPTTPGAIYPNYIGGGYDIYLTKLNSEGSGLIYSTFLGGTGTEWAEKLAVDNSGNAYIVGDTSSLDFPVTPGAYDTIFNANDHGCSLFSNKNGFITKINSTGGGLIYSSFISQAIPMGLKVDNSGNHYITGVTCSPNYPTTPNATYKTFNGELDAIVAKLNSKGDSLLYSSYLGGTNIDFGFGIGIDSLCNIYIVGITNSNDFPTKSPVQGSFKGGHFDLFVTKIKESMGDFDGDGDVDGSDLAIFAANFGRTDCNVNPPCKGDFDSDGDVDKNDLAVFAFEYGKINCPH